MGNARRIVVAAALVAVVAAAAGYATGVGRGADHRSYQDARRLMTGAGFTVTNTSPTLGQNWPAELRHHCSAMLIGFYRDSAAETAQTFVCRSPADAQTMKTTLGAGTVNPGALYSTRQNLLFHVLAENRAAAERLTQALHGS